MLFFAQSTTTPLCCCPLQETFQVVVLLLSSGQWCAVAGGAGRRLHAERLSRLLLLHCGRAGGELRCQAGEDRGQQVGRVLAVQVGGKPQPGQEPRVVPTQSL